MPRHTCSDHLIHRARLSLNLPTTPPPVAPCDMCRNERYTEWVSWLFLTTVALWLFVYTDIMLLPDSVMRWLTTPHRWFS